MCLRFAAERRYASRSWNSVILSMHKPNSLSQPRTHQHQNCIPGKHFKEERVFQNRKQGQEFEGTGRGDRAHTWDDGIVQSVKQAVVISTCHLGSIGQGEARGNLLEERLAKCVVCE